MEEILVSMYIILRTTTAHYSILMFIVHVFRTLHMVTIITRSGFWVMQADQALSATISTT